jgi:hypothetical protein
MCDYCGCRQSGPTAELAGDRALALLATHIDDEEFDVFPHVFHALDPEQWDDIELAHRAVEAVWSNDGVDIVGSSTRSASDGHD